ncbi:hypothetical protein AGR7C_Lc100018 [Agrobacterium deltaense Zutra 3/1]|uniref:Uncharacterized protein n=1 Tax=Agrobacterium deltaense Zutra 3/1 TaxID=1183427 RepID=A0A1S7QQP0_9HYPH|nr:hypothetical protein AGR7C_Lc100018 [Agrobacterium deltaense Zutra 3/1]
MTWRLTASGNSNQLVFGPIVGQDDNLANDQVAFLSWGSISPYNRRYCPAIQSQSGGAGIIR